MPMKQRFMLNFIFDKPVSRDIARALIATAFDGKTYEGGGKKPITFTTKVPKPNFVNGKPVGEIERA
jgi:uncharacterized protein YbjT (DUF2867 family)